MVNAHALETTVNRLLGSPCPTRVGVAVSGGADSLCLTLMLADWAKKKKVQVIAFTVDHGLRPESAQEADWVHWTLIDRGIEHHTLVWVGNKPKTRIEEKAREARYDLLTKACHEHGIGHLFLAHHQDDQVETFWLRLIRSSGLDGLAAMQEKVMRNGICLVRPFLDFSRSDIQGLLRHKYKLSWVEDPSNQSPVFERVRLRQAQEQLDTLGLTGPAVALSVKRLSRAKSALEQITHTFVEQHVEKNKAGYCFVKWDAFNKQPDEIRLRALAAMFEYVGGSPRLPQLEKLLNDLPCRSTLAECQIVCVKQGLYVCAEYAKMSEKKQVLKNKSTHWNDFDVVCNQDVFVGPLGSALQVKGLPALVRRTIPAFFDKKGLAFVPSLDYKRKSTDINGSIEKKE